jgi:hypothetical protein
MDNFAEYTFWFFATLILTVVLILVARLHALDYLVLRNAAREQQGRLMAKPLGVHARWRFLLATILLIGAAGAATISTMMIRLAAKSW